MTFPSWEKRRGKRDPKDLRVATVAGPTTLGHVISHVQPCAVIGFSFPQTSCYAFLCLWPGDILGQSARGRPGACTLWAARVTYLELSYVYHKG